MSEKKDKDAKPKKKGGGMMLKIGAAAALLGVGGGGAYGLVAAGIIGGGGHGEEHEDKNPKLIKKGEEDPYAPAAKEGEHGGEGGGGHEVDGEGGSEYRTAYFSFSDDFTSNLKDSDMLVQVSLACSTHRDYRVILWLQKHELAIRSALLTAIADTPGEEVQTAEGKTRLQKRLVATINKVLNDTEGFGGVDAVYFKTFIVQ